jgi:hypothetical protein
MNPFLARVEAVALISCALAGVGCGAAKNYSQDMQDKDTLWAFSTLLSDLRNSHIAGTPTGTKDITASLPEGGSVRITGETQSSGSSLTYTFAGYHAVLQGTGHRAVFSRIDGDMTSTSSSSSVTYAGSNLDVSGTLERDGYDPVSLQGPMNVDGTYTSAAASGSVNDRPTVSWTSGGSAGGGTCADYEIKCGQTSNGVTVAGGIVPKDKCSCPAGTTAAGVDNVTSGGPYTICSCNGY